MDTTATDEYARRHHGVITGEAARRRGLSKCEVATLVRRGTWIREVEDVFRVAASPVTFHTRVAVALAAAGPAGAASHLTSARLLCIASAARSDLVHVTVPHGSHARRARRAGAIVHETRHVPRSHFGLAPGGLLVTCPPRMVLECLPGLSHGAFLLLLDETMVRFRLKPSALRRMAADLNWRSGRATLERALEVYGNGPTPDSPPEVSLARRLHEAGLPIPELLGLVTLPSGRTVEGDLMYRDARVIIDYHGKASHTARHLPHDAQRSNDIQAAGWTHLVATDADLRPSDRRLPDTIAGLLTPA